MKIAIIANKAQEEEFLLKRNTDGIVVHWLQTGEAIPEADAYFDLIGEDGTMALQDIKNKPVFVNAVSTVSGALPPNAVRINAWQGFLQNDTLEISGNTTAVEKGKLALGQIGWRYQPAPDTPGMITARVVAMIINEAYFGFGEGISSKKDIDTAMLLGTNYPFGPFAWSEKIGVQKIYRLLKTLGHSNTRYAIAPALEAEYNQQINP